MICLFLPTPTFRNQAPGGILIRARPWLDAGSFALMEHQ